MFTRLVGLIIRLVTWIARLVLPLAIRTLRVMFMLATTSLVSLFVGVPTSVNRMADTWVDGAAGIPKAYHQGLRGGAQVIAILILISGWVVLALMAVAALWFLLS